jgi:hypothetical protein
LKAVRWTAASRIFTSNCRFGKEQTLQTCRNSSYVLGIRLDENKPKETAAAE